MLKERPWGGKKDGLVGKIIIVSKREERKSKSKQLSTENKCLSMKNGVS